MSDSSITPRTHRFAAKNIDGSGTHELVFYDYGSVDARVPVICVHGLTRNARDFHRLATALAAQGRRVISISMAGRGESERLNDPMLYNYATYVADCLAVIDNFHFRQVDWIGTSMGGIIGITLAALHPDRIRRLLLNDIGAVLKREALARIFANVSAMPAQFASRDEAIAYLHKAYAGFGLKAEEWPEFTEISLQQVDGHDRLACDPAIAAPLARDTKDYTEINDISLAELWQKVRCPTLILHGQLSDILDEDTVRQMQRIHPFTESMTIPDVGHAPALMSAAQITIVSEWINGQRNEVQSSGLSPLGVTTA